MIGRMLVKVRLEDFFGTGVIKPSFQQLENLPDFVIWLKISDKGPAIVSEKDLIKSIGMSKGQVLDFFDLLDFIDNIRGRNLGGKRWMEE